VQSKSAEAIAVPGSAQPDLGYMILAGTSTCDAIVYVKQPHFNISRALRICNDRLLVRGDNPQS
jgi:hypothetical protein